jgi:hypothetical protein
MAENRSDILAASVDHRTALSLPTIIDPDELAKARLDRRWRDFCLRAELYATRTTWPQPHEGQTLEQIRCQP